EPAERDLTVSWWRSGPSGRGRLTAQDLGTAVHASVGTGKVRERHPGRIRTPQLPQVLLRLAGDPDEPVLPDAQEADPIGRLVRPGGRDDEESLRTQAGVEPEIRLDPDVTLVLEAVDVGEWSAAGIGPAEPAATGVEQVHAVLDQDGPPRAEQVEVGVQVHLG